eukprot:tig00001094_g6990.t1
MRREVFGVLAVLLYFYLQSSLLSRAPASRERQASGPQPLVCVLAGVKLEALLLDVDDTLYPRSAGIWSWQTERILQYMRERMGIPSHAAREVMEEAVRVHGMTLAGLVAGVVPERLRGEVAYAPPDKADFLRFVYDGLPYERIPPLAPETRRALQRAAVPLYVLTNAHAEHAARVLERPAREAYTRALREAGLRDPDAVALVDDSAANTRGARAAGLRALLVGHARHDPRDADCTLAAIEDLPRALPHIFPAEGRPAP